MKKGARGTEICDAAADEGLRDERRQVEVRERSGDFYRWRIDPASHALSIMCEVSGVKFRTVKTIKDASLNRESSRASQLILERLKDFLQIHLH